MRNDKGLCRKLDGSVSHSLAANTYFLHAMCYRVEAATCPLRAQATLGNERVRPDLGQNGCPASKALDCMHACVRAHACAWTCV